MPNLTDEQNAVVDTAIKAFQNEMDAAGAKAWNEIETALQNIEVDESGKLNANDSAQIDAVQMQMFSAIFHGVESAQYESGLNDLKNSLPVLAEMTKEDYKARGLELEQSEKGYDYNRMVKGLVTTMTGDIENELGQQAYKAKILEPADKALLNHYEQGSTKAAMLADMEHRIKDRFYSFSVTSSYTIMQQYTRRLNEIYGQYADDLQWMHYQGHDIDNVIREFCEVRVFGYFHRLEVASWPREYGVELWPGAIPGTDAGSIFVNLGGYNCRHNLVYVSLDEVLKTDIARFNRRRARGEFG